MTRALPSPIKKSKAVPIRLGISQCLLGDPVRYDGGHKRNQFLVDVLGQHVEWVPVCPEVEAGLGTPREPVQLVDDLDEPRVITTDSRKDHTDILRRYAKKRIRDLRSSALSGYVFKKDSPSCGTQGVRVYNRQGHSIGKGKGIFAEAFQREFPIIPIVEEGHLENPGLRENFIERVFGYHRWQCQILNRHLTLRALVSFHTTHAFLLLAHSPQHYRKLSRLVDDAKQCPLRQFVHSYGQLFMEALTVKTTVRKHVHVLKQIAEDFKDKLSVVAHKDLHEVTQEYSKGLVPLDVPINLIRQYVRMLDIHDLRDQVYLATHPKELILRSQD